MDHKLTAPPLKMPVWQGVAGVAETWSGMLPHHHLPPLGGGGCGKACSAMHGGANLGVAKTEAR